jgi:hypothetical protein
MPSMIESAVAVFFLGMGLLALVAPARVVAPFGTVVGTADARNEVRAVYGGFGLVVAALLGFAATRDDSYGDGLVLAIAAALVGMAAGRLVGFAVERPTRFFPTVCFFLIELALAGALVLSRA